MKFGEKVKYGGFTRNCKFSYYNFFGSFVVDVTVTWLSFTLENTSKQTSSAYQLIYGKKKKLFYSEAQDGKEETYAQKEEELLV